MPKKNDMDHMNSLLNHPHINIKPARTPTTPSRGNIDNMPTRPTVLSASDATALNKAFGTDVKAGDKVEYR